MKQNKQKKLLIYLILKRRTKTTIFKNDVLLLTCVFEKTIKVWINDIGINHLYFVSLPGCTWQCDLKYAEINLQTVQDKDLISTLENNIRGGISSDMGDRYENQIKKRLFLWIRLIYMAIQ